MGLVILVRLLAREKLLVLVLLLIGGEVVLVLWRSLVLDVVLVELLEAALAALLFFDFHYNSGLPYFRGNPIGRFSSNL